MSEESMVEKVAKAINDADFVLSVKRAREEDTGDEYVALARAAIEAMREPTKTMLYAGEIEYAGESFGEDCNLTLPEWIVEMAYKAMLDAALEETA